MCWDQAEVKESRQGWVGMLTGHLGFAGKEAMFAVEGLLSLAFHKSLDLNHCGVGSGRR